MYEDTLCCVQINNVTVTHLMCLDLVCKIHTFLHTIIGNSLKQSWLVNHVPCSHIPRDTSLTRAGGRKAVFKKNIYIIYNKIVSNADNYEIEVNQSTVHFSSSLFFWGYSTFQ